MEAVGLALWFVVSAHMCRGIQRLPWSEALETCEAAMRLGSGLSLLSLPDSLLAGSLLDKWVTNCVIRVASNYPCIGPRGELLCSTQGGWGGGAAGGSQTWGEGQVGLGLFSGLLPLAVSISPVSNCSSISQQQILDQSPRCLSLSRVQP